MRSTVSRTSRRNANAVMILGHSLIAFACRPRVMSFGQQAFLSVGNGTGFIDLCVSDVQHRGWRAAGQ